MGKGCSRWDGKQDQVLPQGRRRPKPHLRVQESCSALQAAPGPQCLVGVGKWRLLGFRLCAWPCCGPTVPTATIISGCSQAAPKGYGAGSCSVQRSNHLCKHAGSGAASWIFAARRSASISYYEHESQISCHFFWGSLPSTLECLSGVRLWHKAGFSP